MELELFYSGVQKLSAGKVETLTVQVGAIAGNTNNAANLNYVIIGLVVIIVILIVITLFGNKK